MDLFPLTGKTAIVTGASRGIGEAIAKGFAHAGVDLVLVSRKRDVLENVAKEIKALEKLFLLLLISVFRKKSRGC
jgi:short-subunit dehydrogenase